MSVGELDIYFIDSVTIMHVGAPKMSFVVVLVLVSWRPFLAFLEVLSFINHDCHIFFY